MLEKEIKVSLGCPLVKHQHPFSSRIYPVIALVPLPGERWSQYKVEMSDNLLKSDLESAAGRCGLDFNRNPASQKVFSLCGSPFSSSSSEQQVMPPLSKEVPTKAEKLCVPVLFCNNSIPN